MAEVGDDETPGDRDSNRPPLAKDAQKVLKGLDTGDLVLFDRPCIKMGGFFGAAVCSAAKVVGGSPYDHIGVVVRQQDGSNVLLEASFKGITARPLCERIRRSSANQICIRRLETNLTEEMREEARLFLSEVLHLPYKEGLGGLLQMAQAAFSFPPAKERRRRVHAEAVELSTSITHLESELRSDSDHPALKERLRRAMTRRRKAMVFLERAATRRGKTEDKNDTTSASKAAPTAEGRTVLPSPSPSPSTAAEVTSEVPLHEGGLFCSELVAALYQRLGFLDAPFPKSHDYIPADFAQSLERPVADVGEVGNVIASSIAAPLNRDNASNRDEARAAEFYIPRGGGRVALLGGASLGPGLWVRGGPCSRSPSSSLGSGSGGGGNEGRENPAGPTPISGAAKNPRSLRVKEVAPALELGKPRDDERGWCAVTRKDEDGWGTLQDAKQRHIPSHGNAFVLPFAAPWSRLTLSSGSLPEQHPSRGGPTAKVNAVTMTAAMSLKSASSPDERECLGWDFERSGETYHPEKTWRALGKGKGRDRYRRVSDDNGNGVWAPPMVAATAVTASTAMTPLARYARGRRGLMLGAAGGTIAASAFLAVVSDLVSVLAVGEFHRSY